MTETQSNDDSLEQEENYEAAKLSFEVMASYDVPARYKNHVWLWPLVVMWTFITYMSYGTKGFWFSTVSFGSYVVFLDVASIVIRKHWPI